MNQSHKTFYLFRHGLATHSKYGYGRGIVTKEILPEGVPAIKRIGTQLKPITDSIHFSSEFIRCRQTSEIITQVSGKEFAHDKRLNEKHKERIDQVRERVLDFLREVDRMPQRNIIICTHGVIIAAIKNLLLEGKFVTKNLTDYPLTGVLCVIKDGSAREINFN